MKHFCTYFDRNYLIRGLALYRSLTRHSEPFVLWVLCLDDQTHAALSRLALEGIRLVKLSELETADPDLFSVKESRTRVEYYFTCSPSFPRHLLQAHPEIDVITYLDADTYLYSSPQPVFEELGVGSVLIVPHRFSPGLEHLEQFGRFNVGLISFRNDGAGTAILDRWREQCIAWCYDRVEDGKFADQAYLDAWPSKPGVVVSQHPGVDLAPWNFSRYTIEVDREPPTVDGLPLVLYHFQGVKAVLPGLWNVGLDGYTAMPPQLRRWLYGGYVRALRAEAARARRAGIRLSSGGTLRDGARVLRRLRDSLASGQLIWSVGGSSPRI